VVTASGGAWTLTPAQLAGLSITPPTNSDVDFTLTVVSTATDGTAAAASATANLVVVVNAVADAPSVSFTTVERGGAEPAGEEFPVNTHTTNRQEAPSIAALKSGGFVVVWESASQDSSGTGIYAQRYTATGAALGTEFRINTETIHGQSDPAVASLDNGGFAVVWASVNQDGSATGVYGQRYTPEGLADGSEFRVNTHTTSDQTAPAIASVPGGGFVVVWESTAQDGSGTGIFAQRYAPEGTPQGAEFQINSYTDGVQYFPSVAVLAGGGFVVAWASDGQDGSGDGIYARRYDSAGVAAHGEFKVNSYTTAEQSDAAIAALADGGFVVTWGSLDQDGSDYGIYAQRYDAAGVAVGVEFRANSFTSNTQNSPSVVAFADGGFLIAWESFGQDGSELGVYAQRYDSTGGMVGSEVPVNSVNTGSQSRPSVTTLNDGGDGGFVVAWDSDDQDGDLTGVYARRFPFASGPLEDMPVALTLSGVAADTDGSESLLFRVSGVPAGATLSAGTSEGDGVWRLTPEQIGGLTMSPPAHFSGPLTLTATVITSEAGNAATATASTTLAILIRPMSDTPSLSASDATGSEDTPIALSITSALTDTDDSETLSIKITGAPSGAVLTAGGSVVTASGGAWTLTPAQLESLSITPPTNSDADFTLTIVSTATDGTAAAAAATASLAVTVEPVADPPALTVEPANGDEDNTIPLAISAELVDLPVNQTLSVVVEGLPPGASLSAGVPSGERDSRSWRFEGDDLDALATLALIPEPNQFGTFYLTVTATAPSSIVAPRWRSPSRPSRTLRSWVRSPMARSVKTRPREHRWRLSLHSIRTGTD
jgi:hypothetical protein